MTCLGSTSQFGVYWTASGLMTSFGSKDQLWVYWQALSLLNSLGSTSQLGSAEQLGVKCEAWGLLNSLGSTEQYGRHLTRLGSTDQNEVNWSAWIHIKKFPVNWPAWSQLISLLSINRLGSTVKENRVFIRYMPLGWLASFHVLNQDSQELTRASRSFLRCKLCAHVETAAQAYCTSWDSV